MFLGGEQSRPPTAHIALGARSFTTAARPTDIHRIKDAPGSTGRATGDSIAYMEYVRFAVKFTSLAFICLLVGGYIFLVYNGDVPKPDIDAFVKQIAPSISTGGSAMLSFAIGICFFLTAVAPFVYAARSGDFFTVIVSIVALVVCFAMLVYSRTVIDMVLAAIIYFTSGIISVVMYSTTRIAAAISTSSDVDDLHF